MSTATLRARVAKLEKRRRRHDNYEPTVVELARWIGFHIASAANQTGTEEQRAEGRRLSIVLARSGARAGRERSNQLADLLLRALVGEVSVTPADPA